MFKPRNKIKGMNMKYAIHQVKINDYNVLHYISLPSSGKPSKASASALAEISLIIDSSHPPGKVPKLEILAICTY